jgi:hypothetical protein
MNKRLTGQEGNSKNWVICWSLTEKPQDQLMPFILIINMAPFGVEAVILEKITALAGKQGISTEGNLISLR